MASMPPPGFYSSSGFQDYTIRREARALRGGRHVKVCEHLWIDRRAPSAKAAMSGAQMIEQCPTCGARERIDPC